METYTKQRQKQKRHIVEVANNGTRQVNRITEIKYKLSHKRYT